MKTFFNSTIKNTVVSSLLIAAAVCSLPLHSAETSNTLNKISEWTKACPYIGLVSESVTYGPVTLKKLDMDAQGRLAVVKPGETISCNVHYHVDSDDLEAWRMHHVIVGIKGTHSQSCIVHSLGVWDKKGNANFNLTAPLVSGVYEVRFDYENGYHCDEAIARWIEDAPSSKATMGFIVVE